MPIYDVSAIAHAIEITPKQLDNLLSRNDLDGVERKTRGVTRRISSDAAVTINIAWRLSEATNMPIASALAIAHRLTTEPEHSTPAGEYLTLAVDYAGIRADTLARLDSAVETVGRKRRGRPPKAAMRGGVTDLP